MYAMVSATEVAICAACIAVVQLRVPIRGVFSGTTIESPGFKAAFSGFPAHHPELFFAAITDPSARTTKTALLVRNLRQPSRLAQIPLSAPARPVADCGLVEYLSRHHYIVFSFGY